MKLSSGTSGNDGGTPKIFTKSFWLGSENSAVNTDRFWLYLGAIGIVLCLICLVRAIEISKTH